MFCSIYLYVRSFSERRVFFDFFPFLATLLDFETAYNPDWGFLILAMFGFLVFACFGMNCRWWNSSLAYSRISLVELKRSLFLPFTYAGSYLIMLFCPAGHLDSCYCSPPWTLQQHFLLNLLVSTASLVNFMSFSRRTSYGFISYNSPIALIRPIDSSESLKAVALILLPFFVTLEVSRLVTIDLLLSSLVSHTELLILSTAVLF